MRLRILSPLVLAAFTLVACDDKDGGGDDTSPVQDDTGAGGDDTSAGGDDTGSSGGDDTGSNGGDDTGAGGDDTGEDLEAYWDLPNVYGIPNVDDDDGDRREDWEAGAVSSGENDLSSFVIPGALLAAAGDAGATMTLSLVGSGLRVWENGALLLDDSATSAEISGGADLTLEVEFQDFLDKGEITLSWSEGGATVREATFTAQASPLIFNHHLQPAELVWSTRYSYFGSDNYAMMDAYADVLGANFDELQANQYGYDVWIQDEFEMGYVVGDEGQRIDVFFDTIRDRGLDRFPEDFSDSVDDHAIKVWGAGFGTSQDYGGNLEISPPVTVDGVEYPFGRFYYGAEGWYSPHNEVMDMLDDQKVQAPFKTDASWLCVGHIDEFTTFIPDASSDKGFKFLYADIDAGMAFLSLLDGDTELPKYRRGHGYATIDDIRTDTHLYDLNEELRDTYLEPILDTFIAELDLTEDDILRVPALFETVSYCGGGVAALIPGTANLIVADDEAGETHLFLPDPFLRADEDDQSTDPFIEYMDAALASTGLQTQWVDDWDVYHIGLGEVHCGTNVRRTPHTEDWWTAASHLLE